MAKLLSQKDLSEELGLSLRQTAEWTARPGAPKKKVGGSWKYLWPDFNRWYVEERVSSAVERVKPADLEEARARKTSAEAELAELQLAKERGQLITVEDAAKGADEVFDRVRARLIAVPGKEAHRFVGLKKLPEAVKALGEVVDVALRELSGGDLEDAA
jgi:phage terminase Nu1 subunit (DNA packaging protein)